MSEHVGATTTEVEIFGATYVIRGGQEPAYLAELAAEVDRRMRELAGHVANAEPGRLAILAALNLADELSRSRRSWDGERGAIEARVTELTELLNRALVGRESPAEEPSSRDFAERDRVGLELLGLEKAARRRAKAVRPERESGNPPGGA